MMTLLGKTVPEHREPFGPIVTARTLECPEFQKHLLKQSWIGQVGWEPRLWTQESESRKGPRESLFTLRGDRSVRGVSTFPPAGLAAPLHPSMQHPGQELNGTLGLHFLFLVEQSPRSASSHKGKHSFQPGPSSVASQAQCQVQLLWSTAFPFQMHA